MIGSGGGWGVFLAVLAAFLSDGVAPTGLGPTGPGNLEAVGDTILWTLPPLRRPVRLLDPPAPVSRISFGLARLPVTRLGFADVGLGLPPGSTTPDFARAVGPGPRFGRFGRTVGAAQIPEGVG
ncbi:MAG: hypothetical protein HKO53_11215, partial [Gemmatimonadetes bacterium]|nr:hypothetical protein [Gemmatimonadota bacterium]